MRGHDPVEEARFFDLVRPYFDLEKNTHRSYPAAQYSLQRMAPLASLAGHPERYLHIAHVAGTKGKGSTCFLLAALLKSAGHRCGVFASPHLVTVRERFQVDGELLPYPVLLRHTREFQEKVQGLDPRPTLFEFMTVLALRLFVDEGCRYAVLETGIGGLLDSTNYVPAPEVCAITPVSFDHTELLGSTIAEIAAQKAGIIKSGVPVVVGPQPFGQARRVILERARQCGAPVSGPVRGPLAARWGLASLAPFLQSNFRTALQACRLLGVQPDPAAFRLPSLPGRCERLCADPLVVIDAAHNADSARQLVASLKALYPGVHFTVVLGVVKGKDVPGILRALCRLDADFILTHPRDRGKGSELDALATLAHTIGVPYRVVPAITGRADLPAGCPLLFTGSFFTALIGEELFG